MDFTHFTILNVLELSGWVVAGVFGLIGIFNSQRQSRRQDDDQVASNLITNLKTTADTQEKELIRLRDKEVAQGKEIAHLSGQVKALTEILQGRDPETQKILAQIPYIAQEAKNNNEAIEKMTKVMTEFMEKLTVTLTK